METFLVIAVVCLFVFALAILIKYHTLKNEIKHFSKDVAKLKESDYEQPLKINTFDKDIVNLANSINDHVSISRTLAAEYDAANKKLSNIISGISHDFRTPLTASLGYLQIIKKSENLTPENAEYLDIAISKSQYLKELSDEFFEVTKLENNLEEITEETINLSNLVSEILLSQYQWIEQRKISPEIQIQDGLTITSNTHYITRILENLFSNCEKYAETKLKISLKKCQDHISLKVSNDISQNDSIDVTRVFEPFYRSTSRSKQGSGLGLYVVNTLCNKLDFVPTASISPTGDFEVEITIK